VIYEHRTAEILRRLVYYYYYYNYYYLMMMMIVNLHSALRFGKRLSRKVTFRERCVKTLHSGPFRI